MRRLTKKLTVNGLYDFFYDLLTFKLILDIGQMLMSTGMCVNDQVH